MLKHLPVFAALASLVQFSEGNTLISSQLYSSCSNTGFFPNFSYAKGAQLFVNGSFTCSSGSANVDLSPPSSLHITWYYHDSCTGAPTCGNPALPAGDECCHSTATSVLTFYHLEYISTSLLVQATSTGNVTSGPFTGQSATWLLVDPNVASLNFNCGKGYGQEAWSGLTTITIGKGPVCANGAHYSEACPGWKY